MNLVPIKQGLTRIVGPSRVLAVKAKSPEILLGIGIVGVVGSTVLACKATIRACDVIDGHKVQIAQIKECLELVKDGTADEDEYTPEDQKRDTVIVYSKTGVELAKLYGPSLAIGAASIMCLVGGHNILQSRNVAVMAAYEILDKGYRAYRDRVREEYGEDIDYQFHNGLRAEKIVEIEKGTNGRSKQVTKKVYKIDPSVPSQYARLFGPGNSCWENNPELNLYWLRTQQIWANDLLLAQGHLFLNDVYKALGFEQTSAGAVVGWKVGEGRQNFVDFGMYEGASEASRAFINCEEGSVWLDFNVDGVMYNLI